MGYQIRRRVVVCALLSAIVLSWAAVDPRDAAAVWTNQTIGNFQYWYWDGASKFRYDNTVGRWWHYSTVGLSWHTLSTEGRPNTFIGDGGTYILGNGLNYRYLAANDFGFFTRGAAYRFYYRYAPGQWFTSGFGGGWHVLGAAGLTAAVLGDGAAHTLGDGLNYRYLATNDFGFFTRGAAYRFYYQYGAGKWFTSGFGGGWYVLGAAGLTAAVLGDGAAHTLGNGLNYRYLATNDFGFFTRGAAYRFHYRYATGQWYTSGFGGGWYVLGATGLTAAVLGDGAAHTLGNGLNYRYLATNDFGFITDFFGLYRFYYRYGPGQWYHSGAGGGWYLLGAAGRTASFIADGAYHDLGNNFWYQYIWVQDRGYWNVNGGTSGADDRFSYNYFTGEWWHRRGVSAWLPLSTAGLSARFVGDANYHNLGNGWWYTFIVNNGNWSVDGTDAGLRFQYAYADGQWSHRSPVVGGWDMLGAGGRTAEFIADGNFHDLGNGWQWLYDDVGGAAYWSVSGSTIDGKFEYRYDTGQWSHYNSWFGGGPLTELGNAGLSGSFIADGNFHDLGNGFWYQYMTHVGWWGLDSTGVQQRFAYAYTNGLWYHRGNNGAFNPLGRAGMDTSFLGDGAAHALGNGYSYTYTIATDRGDWNGFPEDYYYDYANGAWWWRTSPFPTYSLLAGPGVGTDLYNPGEP